MSGLEVRVVDNVVVVAEGMGPAGPQGPGVPLGGTTGQVLAKVSATDNDTNWVDQSGGGGAAVLYTAQTLTAPQKTQGRSNIDAEQAGAAAAAVAGHAAGVDPHGDRAFATAADATHTAAAGAHPISGVSGLQTALDLKAPLASPAFTGVPTAPTAAPGTASTQVATAAFVAAAIAALINSSPGALDTLDELAAAMGDDPNFATTITNALAGKLAKASNLADLVDAEAARVNIGAGTAGGQVFTATTAAAIRAILELGGAALLAVGTTAGTVAAGDDARLSDARTPTAHSQDASTITTGTLDAARLPAPNTTTLGGVKRNTGSAGQFVTGVDTDGSLLRDTPAGGGTPAGSGTELQYRDGSTFGAMGGTEWDNTNRALTVTGATLAASAPILYLTQAWNNAAVTFTAEKSNVTSTASAAASLLRDWQVDTVSKVAFRKDGAIQALGLYGTYGSTGAGAFWTGSNQALMGSASGSVHVLAGNLNTGSSYTAIKKPRFYSSGLIGLGASDTVGAGTLDVYFGRDSLGVFAVRDGTTAQTLRVYGTYTDASNYVRASLAATSTAVTLAAETAGTGADNVPVIINPGGTSQVEVGNGVQFTEMTAPSAPAANKVILYAVDNGAGKTQLMALFPSGAAQQVAIEP